MPELDLFVLNFFKYSFPTVDRFSFLTLDGPISGLSAEVK